MCVFVMGGGGGQDEVKSPRVIGVVYLKAYKLYSSVLQGITLYSGGSYPILLRQGREQGEFLKHSSLRVILTLRTDVNDLRAFPLISGLHYINLHGGLFELLTFASAG